MVQSRVSTYQVLVYLAYGFYFLLGASWFGLGMYNGGHFNSAAFFILAIFATQMYYKNLLANLILGIVGLLFSIFMLLQALNYAIPAAKKGPLPAFQQVLVAVPVVSVIMAGVLIFSYLKLNFKD